MKTRWLALPLIIALLLCAALSAYARGGGHVTYYYFTQTRTTAVVKTEQYGEDCVRATAKVGDSITRSNGYIWSVITLLGASPRCTQPEFPIRAYLLPLTGASCVGATPFNAHAGIALPDGWVPAAFTCKTTAADYFFRARNDSTGSGLLISDFENKLGDNLMNYVKYLRNLQMRPLTDPHATDIEQLQINGKPAFRFEVQGLAQPGNFNSTYVVTIINNGHELIVLKAYAQTDKMKSERAILQQLAFDLGGLNSTEDPVVPAAPAAPAAAATQ